MRAALAMLVVAVFGSAAYGQSCPINIAPDAQTAVSFGEPASSRFCGNTRKYHNDGTVEEAPTGGGCLNNPNARLTDLNAVEHAEIRGWVIAHEGGNNGEDEYVMHILLDIGWTTNAVGVVAVNTVQAVAQSLTPQNIIAFGENPP